MAELTTSAAAGGSPPKPRRLLRAVLRIGYLPWFLVVFLPLLAVTTLFWGTMAVLSAAVSPWLSFHCGTIWARCLCWANFTPVTVRGREHGAPGQSYVVMANHSSHFDVLAFYGHWYRQFRWVIKQELRSVPGLGWGCAAVGHIFIDRSDREKAIASLRAAKEQLTGGTSVLFFPEGTRSRDGRMRPFKKGGFMMALDLGLPILPVTITGSRWVLPSKTYSLLPGHIRIQVHEPIDTSGYGLEGRDRLMADVREAIGAPLSDWERGA